MSGKKAAKRVRQFQEGGLAQRRHGFFRPFGTLAER
jgi:hypothetical protein